MKSPAPKLNCRLCGLADCYEVIEVEHFCYGEKGEQLSVSVPVIRCRSCDFVFTDARAEEIRHEAVCIHLGLLTPKMIKHIRKNVLGMTRDTFHMAFGLSQASVERWENGKLLQGEAADTLIRAVEDPAIARRYDRRNRQAVTVEVKSAGNVVWGRFPNLQKKKPRAEDALIRSREFSLRISAS